MTAYHVTSHTASKASNTSLASFLYSIWSTLFVVSHPPQGHRCHHAGVEYPLRKSGWYGIQAPGTEIQRRGWNDLIFLLILLHDYTPDAAGDVTLDSISWKSLHTIRGLSTGGRRPYTILSLRSRLMNCWHFLTRFGRNFTSIASTMDIQHIFTSPPHNAKPQPI